MLRRSLRLQEAGYYTEEGTPSISYREILSRIFLRRSNRGSGSNVNSGDNSDTGAWTVGAQAPETGTPHTGTTGTQEIQTTQPSTWGTQANPTRSTRKQTTRTIMTIISRTRRTEARSMCSFSVKIISGFLLLLLLAFGVKHMHVEMIELQQEVQSLRQRMNMFVPLADTMPNFALESQGARVLDHLSSDTDWPREHIKVIWDRIFYWWCSSKTQRRVIQGHSLLHPGQCWPFSGDRGHLFISLSHPVSITHVTLGHITKSQSPDGYITTAPREVSIYGMSTMDEEGTYLGKLVYDQDGEAYQTFKLPNPDKGVFRYVKLQIENNWGDADNTCLYSVRVHGKLPV